VSCVDWLEVISASLDGALTERERADLERHLAGCAECRRHLLSMRAVKHAIARLASRETPPGAVRARVESLPLERVRSRWFPLLRWTAALIVLTAGWAGWSLRHRAGGVDPGLAEALVDDHLRSVPDVTPAELTTSDPQQVVHFFEGRVPFSPVAPRLPGSRLVGGRLCTLKGKRAELLFYGSGNRTLSLYAFGGDMEVGGCRPARGHWVCDRRIGDMTLLLVGQASGAELRRLLDGASLVTAE
jgi:anti-sigma factor RsiW